MQDHNANGPTQLIIVTRLKRLSHEAKEIGLNPDLIERITTTPDTTIIMVDGATHMVRESMSEVIDKITDYRVQILAAATVAANLDGGVVR